MSILPTDHDASVVRHLRPGEALNIRRMEYFTDPIARPGGLVTNSELRKGARWLPIGRPFSRDLKVHWWLSGTKDYLGDITAPRQGFGELRWQPALQVRPSIKS